VLHLSKDKKTSLGGRKKPSAEKLSRPRLPSGSRLLDVKMKKKLLKRMGQKPRRPPLFPLLRGRRYVQAN